MPIREVDYDPFAEQYVREKELQKRRNILEVDYDPFADSPAATPSKREALQPPASKAGTLGGVASAIGQGAAESVTTVLPSMAGEAMEFVGAELLGSTVEGIGRDLKEWADAKSKSLYGEPKKREGLERWAYEGTKMLAPSIIPAGAIGIGVRVLTGVGKLVKAGKAAQMAAKAAGTAEEAALYATKATEYFDAANKAAKMANNVAAYSTGALFGTAQAQSTRDTAGKRAAQLEAAGDFEGAEEARQAGQGAAPWISGGIEAWGEIIGTKYLGKLFRMDEAGVNKRGAKQLVVDFMKTLGIEIGTEMGQQGGEALTEKVSGIRPDADPIAEALDVMGPTAWMTMLTFGAAGAVNRMRRDPTDSIDLMEEEKTKDQPDISETIAQAIQKAKKEEAKAKPRPSTAEESAMAFEEEQARRQGEAVRAQAPPSRVAVPIGEPQLGVRPEAQPGPVTFNELSPEVEEAARKKEIAAQNAGIPTVPLEPTSEIEKIDQKANEAATSPLNDRPQPTEGQKDAGNYAKGHVKLHGLDISIENPRGSERSGTDKAGKPWSIVMEHPYGYIRGTQGRDKDHLDVFIGPDTESPKAFVVDQIDPETGKWDEHKILMGFNTEEEARQGYLENYQEGWKGLGAITEMPVPEFKKWLKSGRKTKPVAYKEAKAAPEAGVILGGEKAPVQTETVLGGKKAEAKAGERAGLTPPGEKPTFRQFIEAKGMKWPVKQTDPQYAALRQEYDGGGTITPPKAEIAPPAPAGEAVATNFDKIDKVVAGMTGTFRDKTEALKAMEKKGEISKAELGHAIMALGPEIEKAAPAKKVKDNVESLLDEHENGSLTVADIAARLGKAEVSPTIQKALDAYEQAAAEDRFEYGMRGGLDEEAENALMDVIRAEAKAPDLESYAKKLIGNDIKAVTLVGSSVTGKGRDTDIVYDLGKVGLPKDTGKASEAIEALLEQQEGIDLELYDTFIKADGRHFHISSGAGRAVVENTEYGKAQEGKPSKVLAGKPHVEERPAPKPEKREEVSPHLKSLILHDMRTALEEGHKYGMREDPDAVGEGFNHVDMGTSNPPWLWDDVMLAMKQKYDQKTNKEEVVAVLKKEIEGRGHTFTPKQLKIWFLIEAQMKGMAERPYYVKAQSVMEPVVDTLAQDFTEGMEQGQYRFDDLEFPPTEKEVAQAASEVVGEEHAKGNTVLQAYQAERGEAHKEKNAPTAEKAKPAEEVKTAKAEKVSRVNKDIRAWIRFKENEPDPGNSQTIHSIANHTIRPMLRQMEKAGWVKYTDLVKKDTWRKSLDAAGLVDKAWDEEGNTYYGLKGTPLREGLMDEAEANRREEAAKPKEEPTTEPTKAGTQAVIPGASEAETFMLTGAPGEVGTSAPTTGVPQTAGLFEEGEKAKAPEYTPAISTDAKRRLNHLADKASLKFSDLRDPKNGLMSQVQADPILALEYADQMAGKDWEDANFKNNFRKIADFIKKEWPVRSYLDIKGRWKSYAIDRTDEEGENVIGMTPGGIYSSRTVYEYDGKGKPTAEDVAQLRAHGFKGSEGGRVWTSPVTHSETGRVLEEVEKEKKQETATLEEVGGEEEKGKQPWEMQRDEYVADEFEKGKKRAEELISIARSRMPKDIDETKRAFLKNKDYLNLEEKRELDSLSRSNIAVRHGKLVRDALSENKPVPQAVLDEYPGLKKAGKTEQQKQKVNTGLVGKRVVISAVKFDSHKDMVGKVGVVAEALKSRNIYKIDLDDGGKWESMPENVSPAPEPAGEGKGKTPRTKEDIEAEAMAADVRADKIADKRRKVAPDYVETGLYYKDTYINENQSEVSRYDKVKALENPDKDIPTLGKTYYDTILKAEKWLRENPEYDTGKSRTEDVGEELTYNKRNRIRGGIKWSDIEGKNTALKVKETTKQNVHPKPDYAALIEGGMQPIAAHFVKQVYDSIAAKPNASQPTDADLQRYIDGVNRVMDGTVKWASSNEALGQWAKSQVGFAKAMTGTPTNISELGKKVSGLLDTVYFDGWKNYKDEVRIIGGNKVLKALQPGYDEGSRAIKATKEGWPAQQEAWQKRGVKVLETEKAVTVSEGGRYEAGSDKMTPKFYIRANDRSFGNESFDTKAEAQAIIDAMKPWLLTNSRGYVISQHDTEAEATEAARASVKREAKKDQVSEKGTSVEMAERTGPARRMEGEDITSDRLMQTFGFKGVNFGNWMKGDSNNKERQLHLNHAFDSFMDLAEILDVPPKALSLNGMLGLAIGAQGTGKHAAHFVPGVNEINLTRTGGAGAVSHEFGHALDHYFAAQAGLANRPDPFLTEHVTGPIDAEGYTKRAGQKVKAFEGIRPEIVALFKSIVQTMKEKPASAEDVAAKREANRANTEKQLKSWIAHVRKDMSVDGKLDLDAFDRLAEKILNRVDLGDGYVAAGGKTYLSPPVAEMRDLYKKSTGRVYSLDSIKGLQAWVDSYKFQNSEKAAERDHVPQQVTTDYAREAFKLDNEKGGQKYWSTKLEMFARAFDAYVTDTLKANAAKNTYLSGIESAPPRGTERTAINESFKSLIDEIQTRETPQGVEMYEVREDRLGSIIKKSFKTNAIMDILLNESEAQAGPFDGGCLIAAKAIIQAAGGGDLVRLTSKDTGGLSSGNSEGRITEHYGARINGMIYDAGGAYKSEWTWMRDFAAAEKIEKPLLPEEGYDPEGEAPDDPKAVKKIAQVLMKKMEAGPQFSVRDDHRRGALRPAKLEDVKKFFPGQEVGLDANKNIYVKTRGGKYVTLYKVDRIDPDNAVLQAGYGTQKLAPGAVIPGAMGVTPEGAIYVKLHRTFGDVWTLAHESMHFMETAGIINDRDVDVLKSHIKNLHRDGRWDPANKKDIGGPEDRANFIADRLAVKEQRGPIGRIILRIRAFIDGILETFGVRGPESILRGIESGRIFERTGREGRGGEQYAPASRRARYADETKTLPGYFTERQLHQAGIIKRDEMLHWLNAKLHVGQKGKVHGITIDGQYYAYKQDVGFGPFSKEKPGDQYFSVLTPLMDSITQPGILSRAWDEFRYQAQDRFHFLNKAQIEAARRDRAELPESQDGYLAELRYHSMAAAKIEDVEKNHVNPLAELLSKNDIDVEQAGDYLHARHAPEANEVLKRRNPNREDNEALSGMTDDEAHRIVSQIENGPKARVFKEIARRIDAIVEETREILVENGLEKKDTVEAWKNTYKFYVPLHREGKGEAMPRKGRGFEVRGGQKLRAGSTREVVNILANVVAQHEATIVRAEKAKVSRAFLEFAKTHRGPWKIDVPEKTASYDEDGLIQYRANPLGFMLADNVLAVRVDGKDHHITFDERDLNGMKIVSALKNLDAADMGAVVRAVAKISRWLAVVNTSLNPEFIISNFARDIQTAAYNMADSEADAIRMRALRQVGSAFKGIRDFQDNNRDTEWAGWFNRFRNAGGQTGWMQSYETIQDRENALIKKIEDMKPGKVHMVKRGLKAAFDAIADMNTAVENAVRLSVFKNLIEAGVPESKSARIAKELTVNFNRRGNMGPTLNAFYLFYNASIQGSARLISAGMKSRKVRMFMGATVVFAAALDIMNRATGGDDDDGENRYDKIAPWIKDRNLIIMLPGSKGHLQIPLPWGYNVFHVMGQAAGELLTKKNNKATTSALRVGGAIVSAFNPVGGESSLLQMVSPSLLDPFVQWAENKDWSGRKLRPSGNPFAEKPSSQTYWHSVREPSKWIADQLNTLTGGDKVRPGWADYSPESIDLAIDTITGGAGKFVSNLISTPIKYAKGEDVESYEIPFLRRVYGQAGKQVLTQQYYENMDAVRLVSRQLSHYKNDPAKVREIVKEYKAEFRLISRMQATQKAMKELKDQREAVEKIKDPAVRKAREKKIEEVTQKIMNGFNRHYNLSKEKEK